LLDSRIFSKLRQLGEAKAHEARAAIFQRGGERIDRLERKGKCKGPLVDRIPTVPRGRKESEASGAISASRDGGEGEGMMGRRNLWRKF